MKNLWADLKAWCAEGRLFWPRFVLWLWGLSSLYKIYLHKESFSIWSGIILGIHELGHLVFRIFGEFIGIAGGSIAQLAVPLFGIWHFLRQRDYFAITFCFLWLGESFYNLSFYIADAVEQDLPLVAPFGGGQGEIIHDWNYLLTRMQLLRFDDALGGLARWIGFGSVLVYVTFAYLILNEIYRANKTSKNLLT